MSLTEEQIAELEALLAKATPAPVFVKNEQPDYGAEHWDVVDANHRHGVVFAVYDKANIDLYVALRNLAPSLLAAARSGAKMREALADALSCIKYHEDYLAEWPIDDAIPGDDAATIVRIIAKALSHPTEGSGG